MPQWARRLRSLGRQLRPDVPVDSLRSGAPIDSLRSGAPIDSLRSGAPIDSLRSADRSDHLRWALVALSLALVGLLYVTGVDELYKYGVGNHNEQLPAVLHVLDPTYLAADWSVAEKTSITSPRFVYVHVMAALGWLLGVETAYAAVYVAAFAGTVAGVVALCRALYDSWAAPTALLAVYLVPAFRTELFNPGGAGWPGGAFKLYLDKGFLFWNYLVPGAVSTPLVLGGLAALAVRRYRAGYAMLGVATALHVSTGLWALGIGTLAVVAVEVATDDDGAFDPPEGWRAALDALPLRAYGVYALLAGVALVPLGVANLAAGDAMVRATILAWIRHPHHYLPSTWAASDVAKTVVFVGGSLATLSVARAAVFRSARARVFGLVVAVTVPLVLLFGGYVFTEVYTVPAIVSLQPFYAETSLYVVLLGGLFALPAAAWDHLSHPPSAHARTDDGPEGRGLDADLGVQLVVLGILVLAALSAGVSPLSPDVAPTERADYVEEPGSAEARAYDWIAENTPRDAVFVIPVDDADFRLGADRAAVVDWKTVVFTPDGTLEWKERMDAVCGFDVGFDRPTDYGEVFDRCGGRTIPASTVNMLSREYGACWLVASSGVASRALELERVVGEMAIYRSTTAACG